MRVLCVLAMFGCGDDADGASSSSSSDAVTEASTADPSSGVVTTSTSDAPTSSSSASTGVAESSSGGGTMSMSSSSGDESSGSSTGSVITCEGEFPAAWQDGTACASEDEIQVHRYSENTFILRQSLCTSFEGPFLYLLFGSDRVLLEDTGDGGIPVQATVQAVIDMWLEEHALDSIDLVVVNSHGHGDHFAGNGQFIGQPNTTVAGYTVADQQGFFGIVDWPNDIVEYDLGDRVLDVIPIPGHQAAHIAIYDRNEGLLLTGDTLYSGRLYIEDFATYVESVNRLVDFVGEQEVCHVLGTHIEMTTTAGVDFDFGESMHPDEHVLELDLDHLLELRDAVEAMGNDPMIEVHDDFIVYPFE